MPQLAQAPLTDRVSVQIMVIGVVKEMKDQEYRVAMTPQGAAQLISSGHQVLLESTAGLGSDLPDSVYEAVGVEITPSKEILFERSKLILKVKEPITEEYRFFRQDQILFTYLHLAADRALLDFLRAAGVTAIAYETIETTDHRRPLLKPMSEVAGRLAILVGTYYLQKTQGGMGILLSGVAGVEKGVVTVIGGGIVGLNAAKHALALGAIVTIFEKSSAQRAYLDDYFEGRIVILPPYTETLADKLAQSDLVIGAVSKTGDKAPHLVSKEMVAGMRRGAVIVDVAIDQGGCFETSRPTSHSDPIYEVSGVIHYCVTNMPGVVPKTATFALANETFPYVEKLANLGFEAAVASDAALKKGVNIHQGQVVHASVAEAFELETAAF